ncbi:MAG TPA: cytochrome c oxidase subunit 3 [Blastocatellia bacterium]|nr:cytochrome c oxidase subunit 3 [Blastocatellia bacterium]
MTTKKTGEPQIDDGNNRLGGLRGNGGGGDRDPEPERTPPPEGYRLGVWLTLISVTMLFLALTSAYVFNEARNHPIMMPQVLWVNTALILVSSGTIELARRALRRRLEQRFKLWIGVTMALGFGFLAGQLMAWRQLVANGFYLTRNFHSVYAYLFTGLHGAHLMGGLAALAYVMLRAQEKWTAVRRRVSVDMTALYWHFIDGLWIYLLILLFFWKGGGS